MTAREAVYRVLVVQRTKNARISETLDTLARNGGLDGRELALATAISNGVIQNAALLDYYIGAFADRPAKKLQYPVRDILRLSAYQIIFMDKIPHSAAVNEGVELCKRRTPSSAGFCNRVLRLIAINSDKLPELNIADRAELLSVKYSHPKQLVDELVSHIGLDGAEAVLKLNNTPPAVTAQVNKLKTDKLPENLTLDGDITRSDAFRAGLFYIQDDAARLAAAALGVKPGTRVLDCCAAPGGKSFALAIDMKNKGEIIACDARKSKLWRISEGAGRLGISIISTRCADASRLGDGEYVRSCFGKTPILNAFGAVIADVPCSGFGVIRKKPEIRYKKPEELAPLPGIQLAILRGAAGCVKPGGALVYSTCTWREEENGGVIRRFLSDAPDFTVEYEKTLWQHIDGTDGFYICRLRKRG